MDHQQQKKRKVRLLIEMLELPEAGITLNELVEKIAFLRETPITITPVPLPHFISGFSIRTVQSSYQVFFDQTRTGRNRDFVVLHELAHILKGDLDNLPVTSASNLFANGDSNLILEQLQRVVCRSHFNQDCELEQEVELIASYLIQSLTSVEQRNFYESLKPWLG